MTSHHRAPRIGPTLVFPAAVLMLASFGLGTIAASVGALSDGAFTPWNVVAPFVGLAAVLAAVDVAHGDLRPRRPNAYSAAIVAAFLVASTHFLPPTPRYLAIGAAAAGIYYAISAVLTRSKGTRP